jgi:hypothetical protein
MLFHNQTKHLFTLQKVICSVGAYCVAVLLRILDAPASSLDPNAGYSS